jgi:hypothetical protein
MKTIALLPVLLLVVACSSATSMVDKEVRDCGPGQPLEIQAGIQGARNRTTIEPGEDVEFLVEVANNSHEDVIIESIRVEPDRAGRTSGGYEPVYRAVNQEIAEGKEHLFQFPAYRRITSATEDRPQRGFQQASEMIVTVIVKNGDSYRCSFSLAR